MSRFHPVPAVPLPGVPSRPLALMFRHRPDVPQFPTRLVRAIWDELSNMNAKELPTVILDLADNDAVDACSLIGDETTEAGLTAVELILRFGKAPARGARLAAELSEPWVWKLGVYGPGAPAFLAELAALRQRQMRIPPPFFFAAVVHSDAPIPPDVAQNNRLASPLLFDTAGCVRNPIPDTPVTYTRIAAILYDPRARAAAVAGVTRTHWQQVFIAPPSDVNVFPLYRHGMVAATQMTPAHNGASAAPLAERVAAAASRREWLTRTYDAFIKLSPEEREHVVSEMQTTAATMAVRGRDMPTRIACVDAHIWDDEGDCLSFITPSISTVITVRLGSITAARRAVKHIVAKLTERGIDYTECIFIVLIPRNTTDVEIKHGVRAFHGHNVAFAFDHLVSQDPDAHRRLAALAVLAPGSIYAGKAFRVVPLTPMPFCDTLVSESDVRTIDAIISECMDRGVARTAVDPASILPFMHMHGFILAHGDAAVWTWLVKQIAQHFLPRFDNGSTIPVERQGVRVNARRLSLYALRYVTNAYVDSLYPGTGPRYMAYVRRTLGMPVVPLDPAGDQEDDPVMVGWREERGHVPLSRVQWANSYMIRLSVPEIDAWALRIYEVFSEYAFANDRMIVMDFATHLMAVTWNDQYLEIFGTNESAIAELVGHMHNK